MSDPNEEIPELNEPASQKRSRRFPSLAEAIVVLLIIGVSVALLLPSVRSARPTTNRIACKNNLKQIGLALHLYHEKYESFPPAFTTDATGRPLHSWRVLLLPFLEQQALYEQIDLTKPWDDPAHAEVRKVALPFFHCPSNGADPLLTNYVAIVGDDFAFSTKGPRQLSDFKDEKASTIIVMETLNGAGVHWMDPRDAGEGDFLSLTRESKTPHPQAVMVLMVDGAVRTLGMDLIPTEYRRAWLTIDGGEILSNF